MNSCNDGDMLSLCWPTVGPRMACSFWAWCQGPKEHAVFDSCQNHAEPMCDLCWACVGPCWALVGPKREGSFEPEFQSVNDKNETLDDDKNETLVLGACWGHVEPRSSLSGICISCQMHTLFLGHVRPCWAYVGFILVRTCGVPAFIYVNTKKGFQNQDAWGTHKAYGSISMWTDGKRYCFTWKSLSKKK